MNTVKRSSVFSAAVLLLSTLGPPTLAGNTYYRWVDENGTPVNSDRPPPQGIEYEAISTDSGLHRVNLAEEPPPPETASPKQPTDEKSAKAEPEAAAKDPEACQAARRNLDTLNTHARIRMRDSEGGFRFLTEEEKETQREMAKEAIARECE
jgi:hypothetical protein